MIEKIPFAPLVEIGRGIDYLIGQPEEWLFYIDGASCCPICRSRIDCIVTALEYLFEYCPDVYSKMVTSHIDTGNLDALQKLVYLKGCWAGKRHQRKKASIVVKRAARHLEVLTRA